MNATATKAVATLETKRAPIVDDLRRMEKQFALALPEHVSPERFVRVVVTAVQTNSDLLRADRESVLGAAVKCAQDGLLPDGREAALVVYGGKAQYLPMIAGVLAKVRRSGELKTIAAHVVYEKDAFTYTLGDDESIEHKPYLDGPRGKAIAVYAVAKTKDDGVYREVMSIEEVNQVRNVSKAKNNGPWVAWWGEMARKTVLRRLAKRLPMSTDLMQVFQRDDDHYDLGRGAGTAVRLRRLHADFDDPKAPTSPDVIEGEVVEEDVTAETEAAREPDAANNGSGAGAEGFPGDQPAPDVGGYSAGEEVDPQTWCREQLRHIEDVQTLADLDGLTQDTGAFAMFQRLQAESPSDAKTLDAAVRGKRKALADKARAA